MRTDLPRILAFVLIAAACSHSAEPAQKGTAIEQVEAIAKRVARGVEELKGKYPHLKEFSAAEHLRKHVAREGVWSGAKLAPGTANYPDLFSFSYRKGILGRKPHPRSGKKRSGQFIYDPETGISLSVYFFKGPLRSCDGNPPQMIGDLSAHLYVKGPAAGAIRADIQKILDELRNEYK